MRSLAKADLILRSEKKGKKLDFAVNNYEKCKKVN